MKEECIAVIKSLNTFIIRLTHSNQVGQATKSYKRVT